LDNNILITFVVCIIAIFILGKMFAWPLKGILKLVGNSIVGGVIIFLINLVGTSFNFHIGLNIITALVVGILGIPGAALLVILTLFLI
jgi:inhibitor of the pro-sigma K processing machinery